MCRYGKPSLSHPGTQSFFFTSFRASTRVFSFLTSVLGAFLMPPACMGSIINSIISPICNELGQFSFPFFLFQISQCKELHPTVNFLLNCYLRNMENRWTWLVFSLIAISPAFFLLISFTNVTGVLSCRVLVP